MCAGFGALAARFATSRARRVRARSGRKEASISTFLRLSNGFMDIHGRTGYVRCISPLARARRSGRGDVGTRRGLTRRGLECLCRVARRPAPIDNTAAHARCRCRSENTNSGARLRRCPSASRRGHGSCPVRCGPSFWPCIGADAGRAALVAVEAARSARLAATRPPSADDGRRGAARGLRGARDAAGAGIRGKGRGRGMDRAVAYGEHLVRVRVGVRAWSWRCSWCAPHPSPSP